MILTELKNYLQERKQATLADIALHFDSPPDAMRGMLERLIRKGVADKEQINEACGSSCNKCDPAAREVYFWKGDGGRFIRIVADCVINDPSRY